MTFRPIICIDFDGVIHSYEKGWQDGVIYGNITPGFFDWAFHVSTKCDLVIYSSRSKTQAGIDAMRSWLFLHWKKRAEDYCIAAIFDEVSANELELFCIDSSDGSPEKGNVLKFTFANEKPKAFLTIDDRAICFQGTWSDLDLSLESILAFKPWNNR